MNWANPWLHIRLLSVIFILAWLVHVASRSHFAWDFMWTFFSVSSFVYMWTLLILTEFEQIMDREASKNERSS